MRLTPPWPVPSKPVREEAYSREVSLGLGFIWAGEFADGSVMVLCGFPGGARYLRISPITNWAIEESYEGELSEEIASEINEAWSQVLDDLAEQNKEFRKQREAQDQ